MPVAPNDPNADLDEALRRAHPELDAVREAAGKERVYLVGGAVRDLLLGRERADVDLVIVGDASVLAARLGADPVSHERFATAKVQLGEHEIDIATARTERYPHPGALPEVAPAADIHSDLVRRDFTINAMALPLHGPARLIDPAGGRRDLGAGVLRVLHPQSFADDPTRVLRAARYAARFDLELHRSTAELLPTADLITVSAERREAEMRRLAGEETAVTALDLLAVWGILIVQPGAIELAEEIETVLADPLWAGLVEREVALLAAVRPIPKGIGELLDPPERPSQGVELARSRAPLDLVLARAGGAEWLDRYLTEWSKVELEVDGEDLIAAGIPQGPAVGRGLKEALRRKLDGEISGREQEMDVALAAAREQDA